MEGFRTAETPTSSRQMSGFTLGDSTSLPDRQEPPTTRIRGPSHRVNDALPTEWTDEKHCLYLKSMEASFVNYLYNSLDALGLRSPTTEKLSDSQSSQKMHLNTRNTQGQFKVFRGVIWQKINFDKRKAHGDKLNGYRTVVKNSWTQNVTFSFRQVRQCLAREDSSGAESQTFNIRGTKVTAGKFGTLPNCHRSDHKRFQHQNSVDSHTEVWDQNFIGEDIEGEKLGDSKSSENMIKAVAADASSDDQVVPLGSRTVPDDLVRNSVTLEKKDI